MNEVSTPLLDNLLGSPKYCVPEEETILWFHIPWSYNHIPQIYLKMLLLTMLGSILPRITALRF